MALPAFVPRGGLVIFDWPLKSEELGLLRLDQRRVLVVAPQFPAINQPWIDTYLEQLLINALEPAIYSNASTSREYSPKVDELGLRQRILPFSLSSKEVIRGARRTLIPPRITLFFRALSIAGSLGSGWRTLSGGVLSALHFAMAPFGKLDAIHSHDEILAYRFLPLARLRRIPIVLTFHGLPPAGIGQLSAAKRAVLYDELSQVLVNTQFAKRQVTSLGCDPAKVTVLPQGLPVSEFTFTARTAPAPGEALKLLTVGRFHRDKGQAYALLALSRLLNRGTM